MDQKPGEPPSAPPGPRMPTRQEAKKTREAEALRANLKRRKEQARAREVNDQRKTDS